MRHVVRSIAVLLAACAALFAAPAAFAVDSGDIVVVSTRGDVHISVNGVARNLRAGAVLELPASVRTGRDGNVELRQGAPSVNIGPETLLEFPALEKRGAPIDRILQPRGNAFYDIGKRDGRKLRVETPYLVGVIKGTQFNVAAQDEATTISLFEGLLEVRATDDSDVVDLKAGEIASRKRGDKSISVIKMDAGKAPPAAPRPPAGNGSSNGGTPANEGGESLLVDQGAGNTRVDLDVSADARPAEIPLDSSAAVNAGNTLDAATSVVLNSGGPAIDAGAEAALGAGNNLNVIANAAANLGPNVEVVTSVGVDAGPITAALDTSAGVDLAAGAIETSASVGAGVGALTTDVGAGAAVDLPSGTVDTSIAVGASVPGVNVDVGAAAAVDAVAGTVNLGVDVLGADVDVGIDAADTVDTVETVTETVTDTVVNVGGLLDGLLRRPGRR